MISKGKGGCFKKNSRVCFYNIQLLTTKVEILVLQAVKLSPDAKDLSDVPWMEETLSKIWKVSSFTFVLESCSKKVILNKCSTLLFRNKLKKSAVKELI